MFPSSRLPSEHEPSGSEAGEVLQQTIDPQGITHHDPRIQGSKHRIRRLPI